MSERSTHKFQFSASAIAQAAKIEAEYHRERLAHWQERLSAAARRVEETISAKLVKTEVTGGERYSAYVDYGDREAWDELQTADGKIQEHRRALDRYETDARVYGTQGDHAYELDTDDVHHFRLGGQERES